MPATARAVEALESRMRSASTLEDLADPLDHVYVTFETEWSAQPYRKEIHDALGELQTYYRGIRGSMQHYNALSAVVPNIETRRKAEINIKNVVSVFKNTSDMYERMLLLSFVYLMAVEGVYDQSIRVVYVLASHAGGNPMSFPTPHAMSLSSLQSELGQMSNLRNTDVLFNGYENHLRNAIAHSYLTFNPTNQKMGFEDYQPGSGSVSWPYREFDYLELLNYYSKLEDVSTYASYFFHIGHIDDLARMTNII